MTRFHHILFPVDFSDRCRTVRPFVRSIAQQFHSKVTLLHVVQIPTAWYAGLDGGYPIQLDVPAVQEGARCELNTFFEPSEGLVI